jgi:hypothetical protein
MLVCDVLYCPINKKYNACPWRTRSDHSGVTLSWPSGRGLAQVFHTPQILAFRPVAQCTRLYPALDLFSLPAA